VLLSRKHPPHIFPHPDTHVLSPLPCHSDEDYVIEEDTDIKARVAAIAQEAAERRARGTNPAAVTGGGDVPMGDGTS
jgi:hypothetical protein